MLLKLAFLNSYFKGIKLCVQIFFGVLFQVCISRLQDVQLAMVLARLYEEDASGGPLYARILKECLLGQGGSAHEPTQGKLNLSLWLINV